MMPASMNLQSPASSSAIWRMVAGETALQSVNIALPPVPLSAW